MRGSGDKLALPGGGTHATVEDVVLELVAGQPLEEKQGHVLNAPEVKGVEHVGDAVRWLHAASLRAA